MPELLRHTRTMLVATLLAASTLAACGGGDKPSTQPATNTQATTPGTTTHTTTTGPGTTPAKTTTGPSKPPAKVTKVTDPPRSLEAGGLKVEITVDKVVDPITADVDEPQEGGRFVGVFLKTLARGTYEPAKVIAVASLTTTDGKHYLVRVISGGECEGSFFPGAFVLQSKKARVGCIGFDIPKTAQPKQISLGVRSVTSGKSDTAVWSLEGAK